MLLEVNGENVRNYAHNELVTVLKRCPKGNQASFVVLRQQNEVTTIKLSLGSVMIICVLWHGVYGSIKKSAKFSNFVGLVLSLSDL